MRERPILFSAPMVRNLLAGTKTQTRRVVKSKHAEDAAIWRFDSARGLWESGIASGAPGSFGHGEFVRCPYGIGGDRLWVREAFAVPPGSDSQSDVAYRADLTAAQLAEELSVRRLMKRSPAPWKPGIHMPRWASRIALDVAGVRVERLHDIDELDALAEGVEGRSVAGVLDGKPGEYVVGSARDAFAALWDEINGKPRPMLDDDGEPVLDDDDCPIMVASQSWASNPWVWVVEFRRVEAGGKERAA